MPDKLITHVELIPIIPRQGLIAFANVVFQDKIVLNGIGIHTLLSRSGFRLVFPDKNLPNGKRVQLYHPINKEVANEIQDTIIGQYEELLENIVRD